MAIADPAMPAAVRPSRVRHFLDTARALASRVEDELRVSANRINIPTALLLFCLAQLGGCVAPIGAGVWWLSRLSFRVEDLERFRDAQLVINSKTNEQLEQAHDGTAIQSLKDRIRDLERDAISDRKDFTLLEDYTRGRIDRLPFHPPATRR